MGRRFEFTLRQRDTRDHLAAAVEGFHRFEQFLAPVKNPCAGGPAHLVP
jgi:hypothetical protein